MNELYHDDHDAILMYTQNRVMIGKRPFIELKIKPQRCSKCKKLKKQQTWYGQYCDDCLQSKSKQEVQK